MSDTLIATALGGVLALLGSIVQYLFATRQRKATVQAALFAEIDSIVELLRLRGYADDLVEVAKRMEMVMRDVEFRVPLKQSYFIVYEANAASVGELDRDTAAQVVRFYQLAKSVVDSISEKIDYDFESYGSKKAAYYRQIAADIEQLESMGRKITGHTGVATK